MDYTDLIAKLEEKKDKWLKRGQNALTCMGDDARDELVMLKYYSGRYDALCEVIGLLEEEADRERVARERVEEEARMLWRAEMYADAYHAQWDDDPNPFHGNYSEE